MNWSLLGVALLSGALQAPSQRDAGGQPILLGVCARQGPEASFMDVAFFSGASLAVHSWNERGGLLGRAVELVPVGGSGSPKEARAAVGDLVTQGVAGALAPLPTECREVVFKACLRQGIPVLATVEGLELEASTLVDVLVGNFRCARIGLLADTDAHGKDLRKGLEARLSHPFQLVMHESIGVKEKSLRKALQESCPEVLVIDAAPDDVAAALAGALGGTQLPLVLTARSFGATIAGVGRELFFVQGRSPATAPPAGPFLELHRAKHGEPACGSVEAYEMTEMMLTAIEKAGSTEPAAVRAALAGLSIEGPRGQLSCAHAGELPAKLALWRWNEGASPYLPAALAAGEMGAVQRAPDPKLGVPFGALRSDAFQLEEGTQWVRLHFGAPGVATIDQDLKRIGLSTGGASPLLDHLVKEELLGRAMSIASTKFLRDPLGRSISGQSLKVSFTIHLPPKVKESQAWDAQIAGDDPEAGGRAWPGSGHCEVYSTNLLSILLGHELQPPLAAGDLCLLDGSYRFGTDHEKDHRSELIRALINGYAGSMALTTAHEVGHLFGLDHTTDDPACIMNVNEGGGIDPDDAHFSQSAMALLRKSPGVAK